MNTQIQVANADANAARDRAASLPSYQTLKDKLPPIDGSSPSMALLADTSKPDPEEASALVQYHRDGLTPWRKIVIDDMGRAHPAYVAVFAEAYATADQQYARLVKREISWGDYAAMTQQRAATMKASLARTDQQIRAELNDAHRYEVQQRQAAAAAFSQWAYQQQVIAAMSRPVMTNCNRFGTMVNCTSY